MKILSSNINKFICLSTLLTVIGCSVSNVTDYKPNNTNVVTTYNIDLEKYKGIFLVGDYSSVVKPNIVINDNGDGLLTWSSGSKRIFKGVPVGESSGIFPLFGSSKTSIDKNGNGLIAWFQLTTASATQNQYIRAISIKNYKPDGESKIVAEIDNDQTFNYSYMLDVKLDDKGKGLILWSRNNSYKDRDSKIGQNNDAYIADVENYKVNTNSVRSTNSKEPIQIIKKDDNSYKVLPVQSSIQGNLNNRPNIDDNGNGTISWTEYMPTQDKPPNISDSIIRGGSDLNAFPNSQVTSYADFYIQKVNNYKLTGERFLLTSDFSAYTKVDSNGNGAIVYSEYEKEMSQQYPSGFVTVYYRTVTNFVMGEKQKVSNYVNSVNPAINFDKDGNGLIVWHQVPGFIYARRIVNFKLQ